jgi:single-stranded DNA-binding protein
LRIHREYIAKSTGEAKERDSYFDCVAFNRLAQGCRGLKRGDAVIVLGKLNQRRFETSDGNKNTVVEVAADHVGRSLLS